MKYLHLLYVVFRTGYLPGEQTVVAYTVDKKFYSMHADDYIGLYKYGCKSATDMNRYRWPVSLQANGKAYKIKIGLPVSNLPQTTLKSRLLIS